MIVMEDVDMRKYTTFKAGGRGAGHICSRVDKKRRSNLRLSAPKADTLTGLRYTPNELMCCVILNAPY